MAILYSYVKLQVSIIYFTLSFMSIFANQKPAFPEVKLDEDALRTWNGAFPDGQSPL